MFHNLVILTYFFTFVTLRKRAKYDLEYLTFKVNVDAIEMSV